ncbi:MAG TPA: hypothetical protein VM889_03535 [Candidatus Thermoplasmatota archaeon]|nr:hypothetical protein [Candidatus Thermoplasmatota archaeon]
MLRRVTILAVLAVLVAAPFAGAAQNPEIRSDYNVYTDREIAEGFSTAPLGQANCVAEAARGGDATCPLESVGGVGAPSVGVRMLDAVYFSEGPGDPVGDVGAVRRDVESVQSGGGTGQSNNHYVLVADAQRGMNLHRMTGGAVPEVILPGRGSFSAWYGYWSDANGDQIIQVHWAGQHSAAKPKISNEWKSIPSARIPVWVEPGSHPMPTHMYRPDAFTPDFYLKYVSSEIAYRSEGENQYVTHVIFTDGSLFQDATVTTVTNPFLAPNGQRPYTTTSESLVDVDRYSAVASGPVASLYRVLVSPWTNELGSPSVGYCPNGCRVGPFQGDTEAHGPLRMVTSQHYVGYPQESRPGSLSSNAGRDFTNGYMPWVDLLPLWSPVGGHAATLSGPMPGRNPDGSQTMLPGVLSFELFAGVWFDINEDGFIGAVRTREDPYESGTRPIADDYYNARGEFFGSYLMQSATNALRRNEIKVRLTPLTDWGSGVIPLDGYGNPCLTLTSQIPTGLQKCATNGMVVTGTTPIEVALDLDNGVVGRYGLSGMMLKPTSVFMPAGSPGFAVCTPDLHLRYEAGGTATVETLNDCDVIAARVD